MNGHSLPCCCAPAATLAALVESSPMKCRVRACSLILLVLTKLSIRVGSSVVAACWQIGHCRSRYSVTVTGALGSPRTPLCSCTAAAAMGALLTGLGALLEVVTAGGDAVKSAR